MNTNTQQISEELHSIYAIHAARHNVVMLRIVRSSRTHMDNIRTLSEISAEMQMYCTLGTLLTSGKYEEYMNLLFDTLSDEDAAALRDMYKEAIETIQAEEAQKN